MNSKIYTIFYLPNQVVINDGLHHPIVCGEFEGKDEINLLTDHRAQNIAGKNAIYSELTGIYWVWKNTNQEVTGIVHYRRFFTLYPQPVLNKVKFRLSHLMYPFVGKHPLIYTSNINFYKEKILNQAELDGLMDRYDAILPVPRIFNYTVKEHYRKYHDLKDLDLLRQILQEKEPDYLDAFDEVLNDTKLYANNMFILKDAIFQEFMQWWFGFYLNLREG